jgi:hypothetical protein
MGIRYYAYAFDRQLTDFAKEHPFYLIGYDPLGDAWGTDDYYDEVSHPFLHRADKSEGFLYLDKAWSELQALTREGQGVEGAGSWGFPGMRRPLRVGPNDGWTVPIEDDREPPAQCLPEGPTVDPEWDGPHHRRLHAHRPHRRFGAGRRRSPGRRDGNGARSGSGGRRR